jgi:5,10-methylenetetrahydrofolate reductase
MAPEAWEPWLVETRREYGINYLSLVGVSSSKSEHSGISLSQATQVAASHPAGFTLGGVVIAERHNQDKPESMRILYKTRNGCRFFISQAIYDATTTIQLLSDYYQLCLREGIPPTRIILTFIPCGRAKTLEFMRWLGVAIAPQAMQAILEAPVPITKSIEICCENLAAILDQEYAQHLPLGINVESVSINREEIDASIDLFHSLQNVLQSYKQAGIGR